MNAGGRFGTPTFNKRKQFPPGPYSASDNKRPRWDDSTSTPSRKSVSFSEDTKRAAPKKPKTKKAPKPQTPKQPFDLTPALDYLRTWHKARDNWKFNKNHQTLLVKYLYKSDVIPAADIDAFYLYISDIKGASRKRLIEQAEEIRKKDMEDGPKGFPEGTKAPEEKQKQYEETLAELLAKKAELRASGEITNGTGKRSFDESEFVLRTVDKSVQQRTVKRMRAEIIIEELESSQDEESAVTATTSTVNAASSRVKVPVANGEGNDGSKQKAKRRKKLRTADSDSSSSSESDSDSSDSDSSAAGDEEGSGSSSSESDSESDEDMETTNGLDNAESSSSSSSSSSNSGSDSEGADAGADAVTTPLDEDTSGSDGDSESGDSDDDDDA